MGFINVQLSDTTKYSITVYLKCLFVMSSFVAEIKQTENVLFINQYKVSVFILSHHHLLTILPRLALRHNFFPISTRSLYPPISNLLTQPTHTHLHFTFHLVRGLHIRLLSLYILQFPFRHSDSFPSLPRDQIITYFPRSCFFQ